MRSLFQISLFFILLGLFACKKDEVSKPNNVIVSERVSSKLNENGISKVIVYQFENNVYSARSEKVDFKVEQGFLVFPDKGNLISYMSFDKLVTYRLSETYAELYFGL